MVQIIVNGQIKEWNKDTIDYNEVTHLAFPTARGQYTVMYSRGAGSPHYGTLNSESTNDVPVKTGTNFTVTMVDKV